MEKKQRKKLPPLWLVLLLGLGAWALFGVLPIILLRLPTSVVPVNDRDLGHLSSLGDSFGFANALFSGLAFAGIIYAIFQQREELELQREELEATREELKRSADAQAESQKALAAQSRHQFMASYLDALSLLQASGKHLLSTHNAGDYFIGVRGKLYSARARRSIRLALDAIEADAQAFIGVQNTDNIPLEFEIIEGLVSCCQTFFSLWAMIQDDHTDESLEVRPHFMQIATRLQKLSEAYHSTNKDEAKTLLKLSTRLREQLATNPPANDWKSTLFDFGGELNDYTCRSRLVSLIEQL